MSIVAHICLTNTRLGYKNHQLMSSRLLPRGTFHIHTLKINLIQYHGHQSTSVSLRFLSSLLTCLPVKLCLPFSS
ncbi:hypothetical protein PCASD_11770 [Puccinia coronata f. sp. avenae]|uniref:Uncharacterized protein n=1 Tax=Puccinia coronata f. sp. avenae TaxID=200324 RepID=A0A2N5UQY9_9BASI|nr:hypothetical protein PCASD_11770 [Puccinia coronata f. sp. avenae]